MQTSQSASRLLLLCCLLAAAASCLELSINEELPVGTVVANVKRQHFDLHGVDTQGDSFFLFESSRHRGLLAVNASTGDIIVKGRIDREALCHRCDVQCRMEFSVHLGHSGSSVSVTVTVNDVNDCPPTWPTPDGVLRLQFRDGDPPGQHRALAGAQDADCGDGGRVSYRLLNPQSPFALRPVESDSGGRLYLEAVQALDREQRAAYNMTLVASDSGRPALSSSTALVVQVADTNDNAPQFARPLFSPGRQVPEDEPVNSELLRLSASDPDSGAYGSVVFAFADSPGRRQAAAKRQFVVRPDGRVLLARRLDFDTMRDKSFEFEVIARDSARDARYQLTSTATVSVEIGDRIDERPQIDICFLPTGCSAATRPSVRENLPPATRVAEVRVRDSDAGDKVACSVEEEGGAQPAFELQRRRSSHWQVLDLVTTRQLDREQQPRLCFSVTCRDSASLATTRAACADVADVNDSAPKAKKQPILLLVPENSLLPLAATVGDFVTDADADDNGRLSFALDSAGAAIFRIDAASGRLTPRAAFDRERRQYHTFAVVATDAGRPPLSATFSVTVSVQDVNDAAPSFEQQHYRFAVAENRPPLARVGEVRATDADLQLTPASAVAYRLAPAIVDADMRMSAADDWKAFGIDTVTGVISTQRSLDRERQASYSFSVVAEDSLSGGGRRLSGSCQVTVSVSDENDNTPTLQPAAPFRVDRREPGHTVGHLVAADPDDGDNGEVRFEQLEPKDSRLSVDASSGVVLVARPLGQPAGEPTQISLRVRACDLGRPPRCSQPRAYSAAVAEQFLSAAPPAADRRGASGVSGEAAVACLSALLLLLAAATAVVVCLLLRHRAAGSRALRQHSQPAAPDAKSTATATVGGGSRQLYKEYCGLEESSLSGSALLQRSGGNCRPATLGRDGRYYIAATRFLADARALPEQAEYQALSTMPRSPWQRGDAQQQQQQQQQQQLLQQQNVGGYSTLPLGFRPQQRHLQSPIEAAAAAPVPDDRATSPDCQLQQQHSHQHQHHQQRQQQRQLSPYSEASFV